MLLDYFRLICRIIVICEGVCGVVVMVMVVVDDRSTWLIRDIGLLLAADAASFRAGCRVDKVVLLMLLLLVVRSHEFGERHEFQRMDKLTLLS